MKYRPLASHSLGGFTLIEVLLSSVLAATLLAALWALLSMYMKMFDAGQAKAEQSQLVRAIFDQLETDLTSVVQPPPPVPVVPALAIAMPSVSGSLAGTSSPGSKPTFGSNAATSSAGPQSLALQPMTAAGNAAKQQMSPRSRNADIPNRVAARLSGMSGSASGPSPFGPASPADASAASGVTTTTSLRPAGLMGTETSLQIDVAQAAVISADAEFDPQRAPGELGPSRVPELMTIVYSFEENRALNQPLGQTSLHLVRREIAWEDSHPAQRDAREGRPTAILGPQDPSSPTQRLFGKTLTVDPLSTSVENDSTISIPEVVRFGIRYFDGTIWSSEWDSMQRMALPTAVEIALALPPPDDTTARQVAFETPPEDLAAMQPRMQVHRLLIYLPAAGPQSEPAAEVRGLQGSPRNVEPPLKELEHGSNH